MLAVKEVWPCQQYGFFEAKTWILSGWDEKQAVRPVFLLQDLNKNSHFHFIFLSAFFWRNSSSKNSKMLIHKFIRASKKYGWCLLTLSSSVKMILTSGALSLCTLVMVSFTPAKSVGMANVYPKIDQNLFYQTMIVDVYNPNSVCILGVYSAMLKKIIKFCFVVCFPSLF